MCWKRLVVGLAVIGLLPTLASADAQTIGKETLRGIARVGVQVKGIGADAELDGLAAAEMRTDAELALRLAGVRVLSPSEYTTGTPVLLLTVMTFKSGDGVHVSYFYAYSMRAQLFQNARLTSTPLATFQVTTWESTASVGIRPAETISVLRDRAKDIVNQFINDWLAVHPKT